MLPGSDTAVSLMSTHIAYSPVISLEREWVFWSEKLANSPKAAILEMIRKLRERRTKFVLFFSFFALFQLLTRRRALESWVNDTNLADSKKAFVDSIPIDTFGQMLVRWREINIKKTFKSSMSTVNFENCLWRLPASLYAQCCGVDATIWTEMSRLLGFDFERSTRDY